MNLSRFFIFSFVGLYFSFAQAFSLSDLFVESHEMDFEDKLVIRLSNEVSFPEAQSYDDQKRYQVEFKTVPSLLDCHLSLRSPDKLIPAGEYLEVSKQLQTPDFFDDIMGGQFIYGWSVEAMDPEGKNVVGLYCSSVEAFDLEKVQKELARIVEDKTLPEIKIEKLP